MKIKLKTVKTVLDDVEAMRLRVANRSSCC